MGPRRGAALGEFRRLAPDHTPIRIQRWVRRVALSIAIGFMTIIGILVIVNLSLGSNLL